jgi:hypothetical protein
MAGLIQKQMAGAGMAGAGMAAGAPGAPPQGDEGEQADENNPAFQQALTYAYSALYEAQAAKDVAQQLKSAPDLAEAMADVAYSITSVVDERTDGAVPDELLVALAMNVLEEVGAIAEAANLQPEPEVVAAAFKTMILRYLGEQGIDTTELQQAMEQVDPSTFRQSAQESAQEQPQGA